MVNQVFEVANLPLVRMTSNSDIKGTLDAYLV